MGFVRAQKLASSAGLDWPKGAPWRLFRRANLDERRGEAGRAERSRLKVCPWHAHWLAAAGSAAGRWQPAAGSRLPKGGRPRTAASLFLSTISSPLFHPAGAPSAPPASAPPTARGSTTGAHNEARPRRGRGAGQQWKMIISSYERPLSRWTRANDTPSASTIRRSGRHRGPARGRRRGTLSHRAGRRA